MTTATFSTSVEAQQAAALLKGYQFELGGHDARQWVSLWLEFYRPTWVRDAVIEALYQGRYKSVSVRQILELWNRRGQPIRHVTHEFEAAVCREFGEVRLAATALPQDQRRKANIGSIRRAKNAPVRQSSSLRDSIHQAGQAGFGPNATVSFDLSATRTGIASIATPVVVASTDLENRPAAVEIEAVKSEHRSEHNSEDRPKNRSENRLDKEPEKTSRLAVDNGNESYRKVSRSALQSPAETEALLRTQGQLDGALYTSARAIQPFKPALPFSAQTLRLARQKTLV